MSAPPPDPDPAPLVLRRRPGIRWMMRAVAIMLFGLGPGLLCLPLLTGRAGDRTGLAVALLAALLLVGCGVVVLRAGRPDWLRLELDETGIALRQGGRTQRREWDEVGGARVTRRRNGRATIPTLRIACSTGDLYLDDVYAMRLPELARLVKRRCDAAGNPWASRPVSAEATPNQKPNRKRKRWWLAPAMVLLVAAGAAAMARLGLRDFHSAPPPASPTAPTPVQ